MPTHVTAESAFEAAVLSAENATSYMRGADEAFDNNEYEHAGTMATIAQGHSAVAQMMLAFDRIQ